MVTNATNSTTNTTGADGVAIVFPSNPFVGLRPFNSGEALLFFGRGEQTVELLRRLHRDHFIAVVGSSGCGKSSLVRAGLIPKLRAGFLTEDRDRWLVAAMKPGDAPLRNLAAALIEAIPAGGDVEVCAEAIRAGGAQAVIEQLSPSLAHFDANLLLLVDQFEEIFRFGVESGKPEQQAEAEDFVSIMLALAEQRRLPIYVVMTMRSDFLGDCDHFHGLPEAMNRGQYLVPRLTRQQRQQAIEGPILLFGASISPRLLDRLLNEVGDKSDQLPVMQHALMRTWKEWDREATGRDENPQSQSHNPQSIQVDLPHYEAAGGIKDALSKDAEAALDGLGEDELKIAERIFQALTDTDARNRRVRRPAHLSEIVDSASADRETILKIIERFRGGGRSFLTVSNDDDPLIDISHESLIRQWDRMSEWVQTEAESREMYRRVADAARIYRKHGRKRDLLWSGTQLQLASKWREERAPTQQWAERYDSDFWQAMGFLARSRSAESRRNHLFWSVVSMAFIALLGLTLYAWRQQRLAKQQEQIASHLYYAANMSLAQEAAEKKDGARLYELLNVFLPSPENGLRPSARDFYWYYLWRSAHQETVTLRDHEASVFSVAFSPDGKTLASGSFDKTIKLWDVASWRNLATLNGHEAPVSSVAFSPDGRTLASGSWDTTVKLWDVASREDLATLNGHETPVYSVAFSPDGRTLASGSLNNTVKLWDVASRRNLTTLNGHDRAVSSVAFSPDGRTLASGSWDTTVKLWDVATWQNLATLNGHEGIVWSVAFSPDGRTLASGSGPKGVELWDVASRQNLTTLTGHEATVRSVAFSPDGRTLAVGCVDKTVKLWDVASRETLATLNGDVTVLSIAFSPDGKTLASGSEDNTVKLWDAASRQNPATFNGRESSVSSVAFSPDSKTLALVNGYPFSRDHTVRLWDVASRQNLATLNGHDGAVISVAFSPDGRTLASGSWDNTVKLWDAASLQNLATLKGHEGSVWSVAFSPDGRTLASGSYDKTVKLWDLASLQNLATLQGHEDHVNSVAFSPDGRTLASGSDDKTVKLWDVASGRNLNTLNGHVFSVSSVAFSPDGRTMASGSNDKTVKLWYVATWQNVATLKGQEALVRSVAFSPDGKTLASSNGEVLGKGDVALRLWFAAADEEVERQRNK